MEGRRVTRSSRRATTMPVSPIKQAVMANVMQGAGKATAKRGSRKVLADKTNATPVAGLVPSKSPKKAATPIKAEGKAEQQPVTPVVVCGEDLLRSLVHSKLAIIQTPEGLARQSPEAETPQFGVPAAPSPTHDAAHEVSTDVDVSTPPKQGEVVDASPPVESEASVSERLSSAWVGRDVEEVTEVGEDDDSDCSVLVNVSSPGMNKMQQVASPAPVTSIHPTTPKTADFKWQRRDQSLPKTKEQEQASYDEEYEGCDEYDEAEDYDGEVIDCEDICVGISRMGVAEAGLPEHKGRHFRFNYNSDDEIDVEEVDVMRLRGLPTPMGKHLRFPEDQDL